VPQQRRHSLVWQPFSRTTCVSRNKCQHSGFYWSSGGGESWSCRTCSIISNLLLFLHIYVIMSLHVSLLLLVQFPIVLFSYESKTFCIISVDSADSLPPFFCWLCCFGVVEGCKEGFAVTSCQILSHEDVGNQLLLIIYYYYYWRPSIGLAILCFYSKTGFWPSYCQMSTDLDKILHTAIVVWNTLVGRLRPRSAHGRL